ncbi:MAG: hypothetical protein U0S48_20245 [Solirubrobacteraceae bacterium]
MHRDAPPGVELTQDHVFGDDDVVEEHLAELRVPGDLRERAHLDARRAHVDDQIGDAAVRRRDGIRAGEHRAPAGVLRPRRPRLLAAQDEVVAAVLGDRPQRGQVGPGVRLREALAPDLVR